ncbi:metal dependent phosphohydrolase [Pseudodesulfovibrio mercurii]|uniref:Metal dependent phosphohydrolase n=1 Tax=Pseudodesulfovibrio mercurii TaxID=641491 RepID=F0JE52_9BACT|nr:HD domain-containing phosphohydrolase [Pseudodesulfovibrio mercurii]EGB14661.1 metal dependent phosphohydrolase [Pseudodesulfovibrio mercurii]
MAEHPDSGALSETYLQISPNILASFPKFRPPVDLYVFDPSVGRTGRYIRGGERLSRDGQAEVARYAEEGLLYLLRDDYRIYAEHLSRKLGLLLVEEGFQPQEVAEIFFIALRNRMAEFLNQPTEDTLEALRTDVAILAEYIWIDPGRVAFLTHTLERDYDLAVHSVNTMLIGLALYLRLTGGKVEKTVLISLILGLLLHDLGMVMVPKFIRDKERYLVRRDRESIERHIEAGLNMVRRLKIQDPIILECMDQHHERLDGSGYPARRFDGGISTTGRLCAVADSFSAIVGDRPHRSARDTAEAVRMLAGDGKRYDQALTALLAQVMAERVTA